MLEDTVQSVPLSNKQQRIALIASISLSDLNKKCVWHQSLKVLLTSKQSAPDDSLALYLHCHVPLFTVCYFWDVTSLNDFLFSPLSNTSMCFSVIHSYSKPLCAEVIWHHFPKTEGCLSLFTPPSPLPLDRSFVSSQAGTAALRSTLALTST